MDNTTKVISLLNNTFESVFFTNPGLFDPTVDSQGAIIWSLDANEVHDGEDRLDGWYNMLLALEPAINALGYELSLRDDGPKFGARIWPAEWLS
jgi:hypothetical protein